MAALSVSTTTSAVATRLEAPLVDLQLLDLRRFGWYVGVTMMAIVEIIEWPLAILMLEILILMKRR